MLTVGLVGCVQKKSPTAGPARDLYVSPLFLGRRRWAEQTCGRWYILSAMHGLVAPHQRLEPYDMSLNSLTTPQRQDWSSSVLDQLSRSLGRLDQYEFEMHAGRSYFEFGLSHGLEDAGAQVSYPMAGLGIGKQLLRYKIGPEEVSK